VIRGEGTATIKGVTPDEVFDFVLDPAQYTKADTKMVWVTKLADTPDGMVAREDGRFMGKFPGSVITRYRWKRPGSIDVTLEHGVPESLHAWFEIDAVDGGTRLRHVEEIEMGHGLLGRLHDVVAGKWFSKSVELEVAEIARLLGAGQRGRRLHALEPAADATRHDADNAVANKSDGKKVQSNKAQRSESRGREAAGNKVDGNTADGAQTSGDGATTGRQQAEGGSSAG
jgi:hypothetical protein